MDCDLSVISLDFIKMWEVQKVYLVNVRIWVNSTNSKLNNSDQISFVKIQNEPHLVLQKTLRKREVQLSRIGVYIVMIIVSCHTIRIVPNFWEICQTFDRQNGKVNTQAHSTLTTTFYSKIENSIFSGQHLKEIIIFDSKRWAL